MIFLLKKMFGDYAVSLPVEFITRRRPDSSTAQADIIKLRGKRMFDFSEPEHTDSIMTGLLKLITGGDTLSARPLFRNSYISFVPQFKPILLANKLPHIPPESSVGRELSRRLRIVDWNMEFYDVKDPEYDPNNTRHKLALPGGAAVFEKVLTEGAPYFMTYLLRKYYPQYKESGLEEPPSILHRSKAYIQENNPIQQWLQEILDDTLCKVSYMDSNNLATCKVLWDNFSNWYARERFSKKAKPRKEELLNYIDNVLGPREVTDKRKHKMGYAGWEFNQMSDSPSYQPTMEREPPPPSW
tara:strand:+ start:2941 stop:3837 length:897 start_codon:yes stop_codon:yes gene_type:complete